MAKQKLPAVWMRAGTSKGLFIQREHLPKDLSQWAQPLIAAMGADPRQLNGVGGATSTTSKVAVVGISERDGIDVDYTFVQVSVGGGKVDVTGNCGNMASGVGPFALQQGLVKRPRKGEKTVDIRVFNTNTNRVIVETLQVDESGDFREDGDYAMPGLQGITGSEVKVAFVDPAGSMTDQLLPTGNGWDTLAVRGLVGDSTAQSMVKATMLDVANPFILVDASSLPSEMQEPARDDISFLAAVESIRCEGAVRMGLANSLSAAALVRGTPKIAFIWGNGEAKHADSSTNITVRSFSMGKPHPSLQLTGAVCISAGVCLPGTIPYSLARHGYVLGKQELPPTPSRTPSPVWAGEAGSTASDFRIDSAHATYTVKIKHPAGLLNVEVLTRTQTEASGPRVEIERCTISRTARRLFAGDVYF